MAGANVSVPSGPAEQRPPRASSSCSYVRVGMIALPSENIHAYSNRQANGPNSTSRPLSILFVHSTIRDRLKASLHPTRSVAAAEKRRDAQGRLNLRLGRGAQAPQMLATPPIFWFKQQKYALLKSRLFLYSGEINTRIN